MIIIRKSDEERFEECVEYSLRVGLYGKVYSNGGFERIVKLIMKDVVDKFGLMRYEKMLGEGAFHVVALIKGRTEKVLRVKKWIKENDLEVNGELFSDEVINEIRDCLPKFWIKRKLWQVVDVGFDVKRILRRMKELNEINVSFYEWFLDVYSFKMLKLIKWAHKNKLRIYDWKLSNWCFVNNKLVFTDYDFIKEDEKPVMSHKMIRMNDNKKLDKCIMMKEIHDVWIWLCDERDYNVSVGTVEDVRFMEYEMRKRKKIKLGENVKKLIDWVMDENENNEMSDEDESVEQDEERWKEEIEKICETLKMNELNKNKLYNIPLMKIPIQRILPPSILA